MKPFRYSLVFAALAWALPAAVLAARLATLPAAAAPWPKNDIAPDPAIRLGVLPNGMRYAILKNHTPAGAVSVRLSFAVGSTYEEAAERGFSHFVEHMAFRGSKNFPDGELNHSLERLGLRFGADTNASTGLDVTTYMFNLPDAGALDQALAITRDIAGNVSFEAKAAETEAGVIISESQLRDTPGLRTNVSELRFEISDPRASAVPGSDPSIIQHPSADALRSYYRRWYRPERAVLTVVGDVDPDKLAADIAGRFADWRGVGQGGRDPVFHVDTDRGLEARNHTEAGATGRMTMSWVSRATRHPVDRAGWKRLHIYSVALAIANRRMAAMATEGEHVYTGAFAGRREMHRAATLVSLSVNMNEGAQPLAFLMGVRRSLLETPVTQAEIDSVVTAQKAAAERAEAAADTRTTQMLASAIAGEAMLGDVWVSPAQARAALDQDLAGLTPEKMSETLKTLFGAGDPLIFVAGRERFEEAAVLDAWRAAQADKGPVSAASTVAGWPYTDFGPAGRVVNSQSAPDLNVTVVRFANNVRLLVRPSHTRLNQVQVSVRFGNGRLGLPRDSAVPGWLLGGFVAGGLEALSINQMTTALSGKSYGLGFGVGDGAFGFAGQTTPQDLETQLQVFAAYLKAPGFRAAGFEQFRQQAITRLKTADATPSGAIGLNSPAILHGGDKRWALPTAAEMTAVKVEDLKALAKTAFAEGPMDVVITGDVTVEEASRAVAATLGTLPERRGQGLAQGSDPVFPSGAAPVMLSVSSDSATGQTVASMSWATRGLFFTDLKEDATLRFLAALLRERLMDEVRGSGLSYSVGAAPVSSAAFDFGYLATTATMPSGQAQVFYDAAERVIAKVKAGEISADEFERARVPMLKNWRQGVESNDYWLGLLANGWDVEARFERARHYQEALESVTAADVATAARKYLTGAKMVKISAGF